MEGTYFNSAFWNIRQVRRAKAAIQTMLIPKAFPIGGGIHGAEKPQRRIGQQPAEPGGRDAEGHQRVAAQQHQTEARRHHKDRFLQKERQNEGDPVDGDTGQHSRKESRRHIGRRFYRERMPKSQQDALQHCPAQDVRQ